MTATTFVGAVTGNVTGNATGLSGNPSINITDLDVDGHTNLDNVSVAGVTTFTGAISASDIRSNSLNLKNAAGSATYAIFTNGGSALLKHNNTDRLETTASGVTVTGNVTANTFTGNATGLTGNPTISVTDLDVDGHTNLDNVSIAGVTTFAGAIDLNADLDVDGHTNLDNVNVAGVATFASTVVANLFSGSGASIVAINASNIATGTIAVARVPTLNQDTTGTATNATNFNVTANNTTNETVYPVFVDGATGNQGAETDTGLTYNPSTGNLTSTKFTGDGSGLTGITASGSGVVIKHDGSTVGTAGTINFSTNLDVSAISAGIVTVTASGGGVSLSGSTNNTVATVTGSNALQGESNLTFDGSILDVNGVITSNSITLENNGINLQSSHDIGVSATGLYVNNTSNNATIASFQFSSGCILRDTNSTIRLSTTTAGVTVAGTLTATTFSGSGASLTSIPAGQLTGTLPAIDGSNLTGVAANIGITTNLSGTFTASAGTPATINTLTGYSANDLVVEYTIYIKNGSDFQTQKLLAMRDGTTIHSTQFAVMFSSSLLVQCDATISSGNILLRATPETGVSGSTTYKIKREVM